MRGSDGLVMVLGLLLVLVGRLLGGNYWGLAMLGIVADDGAGDAGIGGENCAGARNGRVGTGTPGGR